MMRRNTANDTLKLFAAQCFDDSLGFHFSFGPLRESAPYRASTLPSVWPQNNRVIP
jgi:hypothetical protein